MCAKIKYMNLTGFLIQSEIFKRWVASVKINQATILLKTRLPFIKSLTLYKQIQLLVKVKLSLQNYLPYITYLPINM